MDFNDYQSRAARTAIYPGQGELEGLNYAVLGLCGESGEVAEKLKKAYRDDGEITPQRRDAMLKEVGDVLWYAARVCAELDETLEQVAAENLLKLEGRKALGTISGDGDDR